MIEVTPRHKYTRCALAQAERLSSIFCPVNDEQRAAHSHLSAAIHSGDLLATVEAMRAARVLLRGMSTPQWRAMATSWEDKVNALIFSEGRMMATPEQRV